MLFDEIEKASDSLWNLLLGILDRGVLTLGDNRRVDFSKTMIFLTSNLGASEMEAMLRLGVGLRGPGRGYCGGGREPFPEAGSRREWKPPAAALHPSS